MPRWLIGVDEAGRGPLAGPVAVGLVMAPSEMDIREEFPGVADSKKLTPAARENIYALVEMRAVRGDITFVARFSTHHYIDEYGITSAVERAITSGIKRLKPPRAEVKILLDGLLKAPRHFAQETIIGGDDKVALISLASIVAKVRRDRLMRRLAREYPEYGFEQHKGYGTQAHWDAINMMGLCDIHRRTYCKSVDIAVDEAAQLEV